jgi:hypothetical protein
MFLDYGKLVQRHRALMIQNALNLYGLNAVVTRSEPFYNGNEQILSEPETIFPHEEGRKDFQFNCKLLIDQPMEGLLFDSDVISLSDKLETQYVMTTNVDLELEDNVKVTFPDAKVVNLRIVERVSRHPFTTVGGKYVGVVQ